MIIAFSGPSGSGKTTIINKLEKWAYFKGKKIVVRKEDDFLLIKIAKRIFGQRLFNEYKEEKFFYKRKTQNSSFSKTVSLLYPCVVYLDFLLDHVRYEIFERNAILLQDRCFHDYLVTFRTALGVENMVTRLMKRFMPRQSLLFSLRIDPETSLARNKNNVKGKITATPTFHENVSAAYKALEKETGAVTIDTNENPKRSIEEAKFHITCFDKLSKINTLALVGLDGVGKTSLAKMICQEASLLNFKCKVVHFYHENMLYKILNPSKPKEDNLSFAKSRAYHRDNKGRTSFFKAFLRYADSLVQYYFFLMTSRKKIIICDRFFDDYIVNFEVLQVPQRQVFEGAIPQVDKKLLLLASSEIAYKRKPENTKEFFKLSIEEYKKYAKNKNIDIIDTTIRNTDEVFLRAMQLL